MTGSAAASQTVESGSQHAVTGRNRRPHAEQPGATNTRENGRLVVAAPRVGLATLLPLQASVDCWIQVLDQGDVRTVRVAGRMAQAHIPDLLNACASVSGRVLVDLTDVVSADAIALNALGRIKDAGAELVGVPTYLQFKLDSLAARPRKL